MGIDLQDYDNDGLPDLIITNLANQNMRCTTTMETAASPTTVT